MNKAILIGNLTRDPEARQTPSGVSVCSFSIAVNRRFANAQGERQADFFTIVTWRGLADNCARYLKKGSKVAVCGAIQNRTYDAQDGTKRYITEIIAEDVQFLDRAPSSQDGGMRGTPVEPAPSGDMDDLSGLTTIDDDELPF